MLAHKRKNAGVFDRQQVQRAASEHLFVLLTQCNEAPHEVQQRVRVVVGVFHVHHVERVLAPVDGRHKQPVMWSTREAAVFVRAPLHGGAHAIAVAQKGIVAHSDFVAVVDDGASLERKQDRVNELHALALALQQRRQAAPNAHVDAEAVVCGVLVVHIVALLIRHHFEGELVVVAEEDGPLRVFGDVAGALQHLDKWTPILAAQRHKEARHNREVERHLHAGAGAVVVFAEIRQRIFGPLVGLGQQDLARAVALLDGSAQGLDVFNRLWQILTGGSFALIQIRHSIQSKPINPHIQPEEHDLLHLGPHLRVVEVQIGLVAKETMPIVLLRLGVPRPVRLFSIGKYDADIFVLIVRLAPHVPVVLVGFGVARLLKPGVLVGGVV